MEKKMVEIDLDALMEMVIQLDAAQARDIINAPGLEKAD